MGEIGSGRVDERAFLCSATKFERRTDTTGECDCYSTRKPNDRPYSNRSLVQPGMVRIYMGDHLFPLTRADTSGLFRPGLAKLDTLSPK